ncbi:hypothetical protein [Serratia ureilytica]|uniref:hypothetical protein n=2 Tax=Serratia ureilytica TaxID=300181 RepID=UPI002FE5B012
MKKNYRGWQHYMCCRGWGYMLLLSGAGGAIAADEPYLQLDTRMVEVPYQWQLPDGEVLRKGVSDQAARVAVVQRKGHEDYVLETIWDRFSVRVPARCWKLQVAQFESCVYIGPRENSTRQSEVEQSIDQEISVRQQNRERRVTWASEQIGLEQVPRILEAAFARHERWLALSSGHADSAAFLCGRLKGALAAVPSQSTLPRRDMMAGRPEAVAAYVQAARGGGVTGALLPGCSTR